MINNWILFGIISLGILIAPDFVYAQGTYFATIASNLCSVYDEINGPTGRAFATLIICLLGFGAIFGKLNWGILIMTIIALAFIFAAETAVMLITGSAPC